MCLPALWDATTEQCPLSPVFLPGPVTKVTSIPVPQHRSILPLWSPLGKLSIKSESKSDLKTAYDSSTSLGLLPCCPGVCPLLPSPATGTFHRSRGQHCYSDKTELRESLLRAVLALTYSLVCASFFANIALMLALLDCPST